MIKIKLIDFKYYFTAKIAKLWRKNKHSLNYFSPKYFCSSMYSGMLVTRLTKQT